MSFSQPELDIIAYGKANGKTKQEVQDAINRLRTGRPYTTQAPQAPTRESPSSIISTAAGAGVDKFKQGLDMAQGPQITDAIAGGTKAAAGATEVAFSPLAPLMKPIADAFAKLTDFLGGTKPVQAAASAIPAGGTVEKALGYAADTGEIAGALAGAKTAPAALEKAITTAGRGAEALGGITKSGLEGIAEAKASSQIPANIMQRVARVSKGKQANFEKMAGQGVGQYLVDRGIFGNVDQITEQLFRRFTQSKDTADAALAKLPGVYKYTPVRTALDELMSREAKVSTPGAMSPDFRTIRELSNKYDAGGLTMEEINTVKRIYERNVRLGYLKENKQDSIARATNIDSAIRTWQAQTADKLGLKNLPDINRETRLAKQLMDDLGVEYASSAGNNAITLTDWIMLSGGDATAAAGFLTKKLMSSKTVMSKVAEKLAPAPKSEVNAPITSNLDFISSYGDWIRSLEGKGSAAASASKTATAGRTTLPQQQLGGIGGQKPSPQTLSRQSEPATLQSSAPKADRATIIGNESNPGLVDSLSRMSGDALIRVRDYISELIDNAKNNGQRGFVKNPLSAQKADTSVPFDGNKPLSVQQQGMKDTALRIAKQRGVEITPQGNLVLYHGTKEGRAPIEGDNWRIGSYFTDNPKTAAEFANAGNGGKVQVMKVEVPPQVVFNSGDGSYWNSNEAFPVKSVSSPSIPKELQPLAAEARKYATAEEFVKAQGEPLYHGTNAVFTQFDPETIGKRDSGWFGKGFYFTQSKGEAATYGKNVMQVYLDMKNPFDFSKYNAPGVFRGTSVEPSYSLSHMSKDVPILGEKLEIQVIDTPPNATNGYTATFKDVPLRDYTSMVEKENLSKKASHVFIEDRNGDGVHLYGYKKLNGEDGTLRFYGKEKDVMPDELLNYALFDQKYSVDNGAGGLYGVQRKISDNIGDAFTENLKKNGYDGTIQSPEGDEYVAFYPSQVKTKSQLIDIWHKANGK